MEIGLYLHIPFCTQKCPYCDFNSFAGLDALHAPYAQALMAEMAALAMWRPWQVRSIFVGGGTPTVLSLVLLRSMLASAFDVFGISSQIEITVEANPGTVDEAYLGEMRAAGVNRLSLGAQSLQRHELELLGRGHSVADVRAAFAAARKVGFENISLDLIYGLPGQSLGGWQSTLEQAAGLAPEHLSLYCLTVEEETPLAARISRGEIPPPDDDVAADMYELAQERLARAGFYHYEISNWARDTSFFCRHNLIYWRNEPYLGVGAGAHSSCCGYRWHNCLNPHQYVAVVGTGEGTVSPWASPTVAQVEAISEALAMGETMMLGLRLLQEGVPLERFEARFGRSLLDVYAQEVAALSDAGLLECLPDRLRLTRQGRLLGNQAFASFLPAA
ncbi:MAG: radical SAM family heme chaperone HemW [Chloroflexota bacterium]